MCNGVAQPYTLILHILISDSRRKHHGNQSSLLFSGYCQSGSITNAVNFLHVTQPILSRQILDLEDELGQKRFTHGSHNMTLTVEGMILTR